MICGAIYARARRGNSRNPISDGLEFGLRHIATEYELRTVFGRVPSHAVQRVVRWKRCGARGTSGRGSVPHAAENQLYPGAQLIDSAAHWPEVVQGVGGDDSEPGDGHDGREARQAP